MTPLDALAPDQRAVLELLLRQGRSYGDLSEMLGIPEETVRERAHAALEHLAPEAPPGGAATASPTGCWASRAPPPPSARAAR